MIPIEDINYLLSYVEAENEKDLHEIKLSVQARIDNVRAWLTRAAEHRNEAEKEQDCPACHGKKSYPVNGHDAPCEWCCEIGQS